MTHRVAHAAPDIATPTPDADGAGASLRALYRAVRHRTEALCAPLTIEDHLVQSMPEASPVKWHLAHTSWFFETFVLAPYQSDYSLYHPKYTYLFNSYYDA